MGTPPLFLIDRFPDDDTVVLAGDEGRHAARVRRIGAGERVLLGDGAGGVLDCTVREARPDSLLLAIDARRTEPAPSPRLVLVQALPKGERAELAVEVTTELGVDEIVPWAASRSVTQWQGARGEKALERWRRTAREAAKQSRRAFVPTIAPLATTAQVAARLRSSAGLVLHESAATSLSTAPLPASRDLLLVVGPEGGISDEELTAFGAPAVRLGAPVLRTSTAGAAALAALSLRLGRWG